MSGTRHERRGSRDGEDYTIELLDPQRIALPLLDEIDRPTPSGRDLIDYFNKVGYRVEIKRI